MYGNTQILKKFKKCNRINYLKTKVDVRFIQRLSSYLAMNTEPSEVTSQLMVHKEIISVHC